jgi:hypothetical protein
MLAAEFVPVQKNHRDLQRLEKGFPWQQHAGDAVGELAQAARIRGG